MTLQLLTGRTASAAALTFAILAAALGAAGCCNALKAPNRCAACVYDNCIVPYASRSAENPAATTSVMPARDRAPRAAEPAGLMAY